MKRLLFVALLCAGPVWADDGAGRLAFYRPDGTTPAAVPQEEHQTPPLRGLWRLEGDPRVFHSAREAVLALLEQKGWAPEKEKGSRLTTDPQTLQVMRHGRFETLVVSVTVPGFGTVWQDLEP